ncbi:MAG TPA: glycosyltransferase family 4 protein [Micromonosporaceae bacterium]|nr:glycosyltransferase family 4 protein [Micromonosporaceae bacterium]
MATAGDRIRVAVVHGPGRPDEDGVSDYVARLLRALDKVGVTAIPVQLRPVQNRWLAATARGARRIRRLRPDLVHVQFAPSAYRFSAAPGLLPLLLPRRLPLVTTLHEYGGWGGPLPAALCRPVQHSGVWDRETGRLVPASEVLIVTNQEHAEAVAARTGRRAVQVPLAPNVDDHGGAEAARQRWRQRLGLGPDGELLVFFGFVHPVKGVRYLLEALGTLRRVRGDVRLLVVGGFTSQALPEPEAQAFRRELEEISRRCGVAEAVTFTGHLPAPAASAAVHAADVVVLPFTAGVTAKSGSLLTALTHGRPTAVTVPDQPDPILRPDETVAVIPGRRDPEAIADTVQRLLGDASLRRRLADGGRELAARHSWPAVAGAHRQVYERLLGVGSDG